MSDSNNGKWNAFLDHVDLTELITVIVIGALAAIGFLKGIDGADYLGAGLVGYLTKSLKSMND